MERSQATGFFQINFRDWPQWWSQLSPFSKWFPAAGVVAYWVTIASLGGMKSDHWLPGLIILALAYIGPKARGLLSLILPIILTAMVYDSQRYYGSLIRGRIRVAEPYEFDKAFFGIVSPSGVLTPNEWFMQNTNLFLDLLTGFFYLTFIAIFVLIAVYFRYWLPRKKNTLHSPEKTKRLSIRMMWAFFWVNVIGYSTYYWFPAAPPWYAAKYGFGPVNFNAPPDPAGCARFDAFFGIDVFANMYAKSANIFGAIPSMHVAYPMLALLFAFRIGALRGFAIIYCIGVSFAAIYLNHHYVLDVLWGWSYSILIAWVVNQIAERRERGLKLI